jgi:hypothetical protein
MTYNVPIVDFVGPLSKIGENFGNAAKDRRLNSVLSSVPRGPNGEFDFDVASQALMQAGFGEEGSKFALIAERNRPDVPSGFRAKQDGTLEPIPGGPSDPEYLKVKPSSFRTGPTLPAGYNWKDPNNPSAGMFPIEGGPGEKIPAEVAARQGLAKSFMDQYPKIRKRIESGEYTGAWDAGKAGAGIGGPGEIRRQIDSGAEALLRNLTGAGMNYEEARNYVRRYQYSYTDTAQTAIAKLDQLARELGYVGEAVGKGRGGSDLPPPPDNQPNIPQEAIAALRADPSLKDQFEEYYKVPAEDYMQ